MQSLNLSPRWRKLLVTAHVAATVSVLGADLVLLALGLSGAGGADPRTIYPAAHLVGTRLVAPLAALSLGSGLLLGLLTPWGLLRYWWVAIKLVITAALSGAVLFVLIPRLGAAATAATGPAPGMLTDGQGTPLVVAPANRCATGASKRSERNQPDDAHGIVRPAGQSHRGAALARQRTARDRGDERGASPRRSHRSRTRDDLRRDP
jgi:hypothetical protein